MKQLLFLFFTCIAVSGFGQMDGTALTKAEVAALPRISESIICGILTVETFFGPPGYGEDPENDEKEECFILVLEEDPAGETPKMQIIYLGETDVTMLVGKAVCVTGNFIGAHTGHHNTPILIETREIKAAE